MNLLNQIKHAATESQVPLSDLLRKALILAYSINADELKNWVQAELNGYDGADELPPYRQLRVHSKGNFVGGFGASLSNASIPLGCVPTEFRERLAQAPFRHPIAVIDDLLQSGQKTFQAPWPPDLVVSIARKVYVDMTCMNAWQEIPRPAVTAIADTVRTRLLQFVLELEREAPGSNNEDADISKVPIERVTQIFNTYVNAPVGNLAAGSQIAQDQGIGLAIPAGDLTALKGLLANTVGASPEDIRSLEAALEEDAPSTQKSIGKRTTAWLTSMLQKAASGALKVGAEAGTKLLTQAIAQYLGLPP